MSDDEPAAWAIVAADNDAVLDSHLYHTESIAARWATQHGDRVVPLYRSPQTCPHVVGKTTLHCSLTPFTLTDAEREAISRVYDLLCDRSRELQSATRLDEARPLIQWAKTLHGLWERTK